MEEITIIPKLNGWAVEVGCREVVFQDKQEMLDEIDRYIESPNEVRNEYMENAKNNQAGSLLSFNGWAVHTPD